MCLYLKGSHYYCFCGLSGEKVILCCCEEQILVVVDQLFRGDEIFLWS